MLSENEFVDWLRHRLSRGPDDPVPLGDDAAVVAWEKRHDCVITTDMLADGVHFELAQVDPERVGRKALAVNLSDLAAMAALPVAAVVSLLLPRDCDNDLSQRLLLGMDHLAREFELAIVGGDTNAWQGPLVINVTAVGTVTDRGPLRRDGARPGDAVLVTGKLGGSRLGKHYDFQPRVREALKLNRDYVLSAGMDISDGLLLDLSRMAAASGCGAMLEWDQVPISPDAQTWAGTSGHQQSALHHACSDGEDFELLLAAAPPVAAQMLADQPLEVPLTQVGQFVANPGLWANSPQGTQPIQPEGFDHLRK